MFYLMAVVFASLKLGPGPALMTALISSVVFDFWFIPPYRSFAITDVWYLVTLITFMGVAQLISLLTSTAREQALAAKEQEAAKAQALVVLAGGLAHDFNNLLTAILGNASLALATLADGHPVSTMLREIVSASERAAILVSQILAYSGKGRFFDEFIDLSQVVNALLEETGGAVPANIRLRVDLARELPRVKADRNQLRQLIGNLYLNAIEAIAHDPGIVSITTGSDIIDAEAQSIELGEASKPGKYVYVRVTDTGCGIEDTIRPRIFDPFFTTKFVGRGLGLSAVHGIVRAHNGLIRLSSQPGFGSTFMCLFPVEGEVSQ
jgi:signal transduction histidine kinase